MTASSNPGSLHSRFLSRPDDAPWMVGLATSAAGSLPYPLSERDIEADTAHALRVFAELGLARAELVHMIGDGAEEIVWWPFENAAMRMGIPWIQAEGGPHDTARSDMVLRRFRPHAVLGMSLPVLDALGELGRDLHGMLGNLRALTATPQAAIKLRSLGIACRVQALLGPIFLFEAADGSGLRYDESEWLVESLDGELVLTAVSARMSPFSRLRTGQRGRVGRIERDGRREARVLFD
ncbi:MULTISPECIES: hypothetical protein [Hydrocarboniphaga]|uniref:hypothetical protein n=1 Tax=Hydrocarboniphaga TaxID=243627 RepID=UPI0012FC769D|nr:MULTISPECIES: hypothetical protein [Hydrocarboniphaga]MDZ4079849.1 hypothetical protein [Hydrocarboniphaga sp.]